MDHRKIISDIDERVRRCEAEIDRGDECSCETPLVTISASGSAECLRCERWIREDRAALAEPAMGLVPVKTSGDALDELALDG